MRTVLYLTRDRLRHLDSYAYSSIDKSFVSAYILQPYWRFCAQFLPPWLAPNTVTLIGFAAIVVNFASIAILDPSLASPGPILCIACGLGLFFYQTMDALDGKQARATGTSSPLGECVDHGFDTLNCALSGTIQAAMLGLGNTPRALLCILLPCWSMYLSTWEEFHTSTLYLGYINGPTEGILIAVALCFVTAFKGSAFWNTPLINHIAIPLLPASTTCSDVVLATAVLLFIFAHLPFCLLNVQDAIRSRSSRALTGRAVTPALREAFSQLFPIVAFTALATFWVLSPWSCILADQKIVEFAVLTCFLYGQLSSKIIVAHLTKGPFPFSPALVLALVPPAVGTWLPMLSIPVFLPFEVLYLRIVTALAFLSWLTSATLVVNGFCSYLKISAFTIPPRVDHRRRSNTGLREEGLAGRKMARLN